MRDDYWDAEQCRFYGPQLSLRAQAPEKHKYSVSSGTWGDEMKQEAEIRTAIDILFSTSWWISQERKLESLEKVQDFFNDDYQWLPAPAKNRIYPEA